MREFIHVFLNLVFGGWYGPLVCALLALFAGALYASAPGANDEQVEDWANGLATVSAGQP